MDGFISASVVPTPGRRGWAAVLHTISMQEVCAEDTALSGRIMRRDSTHGYRPNLSSPAEL